MKFKHGVRQKVASSCVEKVDASDFVCYNGDTALRFELSGHREGFLLGETK
jgi:hypothetical protein